LFFLRWRGEKFLAPELSVSVIMPTLNRARYLESTIESLIKQDFPRRKYEILVLDNNSIDDTRKVSQEAINKYSRNNIKYLFEPVPGLLSGRHRGAKEAVGDVLVFIDDDIIADSGWLKAIVKTFDDPSVHLVGGPSLPLYEADPPEWLEEFWIQHKFGRECGDLSLIDLGPDQKEIDPIFVWGLNMSVRRKTFYDLGGTHPDCIPEHLQKYQGDGETGLSLRIAKAGLKAIYQPKALVRHRISEDRMTIESFEKRYFYQGICDSFTRIREKNGINNEMGNFSENDITLCSILDKADDRTPIREIKKIFRKRYVKGFLFHQNQVANDDQLLEWVLRENFLDYRLPSSAGI
jgi:glycosyltransferase involved in cell wall biosynthesis